MFKRIIEFFREWWSMRNYVKVKVIEQDKRAEPFNVTTLIHRPKTDLAELFFEFVTRHVKYVRENRDYWQTPEETLVCGKGDCEDGSILFASLLQSALPRCERWRVFVAVYEQPAHVVVIYRGKVFDWTQKRVFSVKEISHWKLLYMFNFRHAYITRESVEKWRR